MLQHSCSKENRGDSRSHGLLWSRNYNDHILEGRGELNRWFQYLQDNPRRLALRRAHPDFFRVVFDINIAGQTYAAIGNRFLLSYPEKQQVQCSRSLTDEQIEDTVKQMLAKARRGAVLVSPAISKGEQAVMRAALEAHLPLIFLTPFTSCGNAPFYSSEKVVGSWHIKTLWFNISIMLLMSILCIVLLLTDCPGKYVRK